MEHVLRSQSKTASLSVAFLLGVSLLLGSLLTPYSAYAAALSSTNVEPASLVAGASGSVTITFTTATTVPNNGRVEVTFPSGFDVTGATGGTCSTMDGTFTTGVSSQTVRIVRNGDGAGEGAGPQTCTVGGIINPTVAGSTGTYAIRTLDNVPSEIDADTGVTADTIVAATLTSTNVQPISLRTRTMNTVTVSFTTVNALANNGKIKITFPAGFDVDVAANGTCSSMDGSFATTLAGQVVTLTRSGGSSEPAGAQTCTIPDIVNPSNVGAAGTYTITTTNSSDAVHDQDTAVSSDNFTSSSSADEEEVEITYSVNLLAPEDGDSLEAGSMTDITWESDGGQASYANLFYSEDGGDTWETIVTNTVNDGEYTWTVPSLDSDEVMVKVVTTDLAEELATDTSAAFSVWLYAEDESDDVSEEDEDVYEDEEMPEDIDGIMTGDYIKLEDSSTIYYVDEYMMRRPFYDAQTYFTYEDDFDAVVEVSADTMAEFTIGAPMLPKAGVVLVKIQSIAAVYMVEETTDGSYELRWITSEEVAEEMFGSSWASYVIDVDATLFTRYDMGHDVDEAEDVDTDMMKYRTDLHE